MATAPEEQTLTRKDALRFIDEALGRQMRVIGLFAVLLLVLGFFLGHYVAASHSRIVAFEFRRDLDALNQQLAEIEDRRATEQQTALARIAQEQVAAAARAESLRLQRATVEQMLARVEEDRLTCMNELAPYLGRKRAIAADKVSATLTRVFAAQIDDLQHLLDPAEGRPADPAHDAVEEPAPPPPRDEADRPTTSWDALPAPLPPASRELAAPAAGVQTRPAVHAQAMLDAAASVESRAPQTATGGENQRYFPSVPQRSMRFFSSGRTTPDPLTVVGEARSIDTKR